MANHIIHKQKVIVHISDVDRAFDYQQMISDLMSNGLAVDIETLLDEMDIPGTVVRIEKLDIDLEKINATNFSNEFKDKLLSELNQSLQSIHTNPNAHVEIIQKSDSLKNAFFYFMTKGRLPWYVQAKNMADLENDIFSEWKKTDWRSAVDWLQKEGDESMIKRLAWQFSQRFLSSIFNAAFENDESVSVFADIQNVYQKLNAPQDEYLLEIFKTFLRKDRRPIDELAAGVLLSRIKKNEKGNLEPFSNSSFDDINSSLVNLIIQNISLLRMNNFSLDQITPKSLLVDPTDDAWLERMRQLAARKISEEQSLKDAHNKKAKDNDDDEVLFVDNCGLVLLHPFLKAYFEELNLVDGEDFILDEARRKAVLLLHYLSTGSTETAEFNVMLEKILCGCNSEDSVPAAIKLSPHEMNESSNLLQTVINYWPPLNKTSIEGLRETFLQRKGKLMKTATGWRLTVEQKTVDILLNKLPWGYSTVKLPWMNEMISVEWY